MDIIVDIERFLPMFWVALYLSDLQFGAPAGAQSVALADISNGSAFADVHARYPDYI
jgi:hypothetical protein